MGHEPAIVDARPAHGAGQQGPELTILVVEAHGLGPGLG